MQKLHNVEYFYATCKVGTGGLKQIEVDIVLKNIKVKPKMISGSLLQFRNFKLQIYIVYILKENIFTYRNYRLIT